jgi:hypothetical protein
MPRTSAADRERRHGLDMPPALNETLMTETIAVHPSLHAVAFQPLFAMQMTVNQIYRFGGAGVTRQAGMVGEGRFVGERLAGQVLSGGSDWQSILADGTILLECRLPLRTDDGAYIVMDYGGVRAVSPDVQARMTAGEDVDPRDYHFRINPTFFTSDPRYDWLNRVVAFGLGQRLSSGPVYNVFELK